MPKASPGDDERLMRLAARLRSVREDQGVTQDEIVERMGYKNRPDISAYENGKRRLYAHDLPAYAAALGVSVSQLLGEGVPTDPVEIAALELLRSVPAERRELLLELMQRLAPLVMGDVSLSASTDRILERFRGKSDQEQIEILERAEHEAREEFEQGSRRGGSSSGQNGT